MMRNTCIGIFEYLVNDAFLRNIFQEKCLNEEFVEIYIIWGYLSDLGTTLKNFVKGNLFV